MLDKWHVQLTEHLTVWELWYFKAVTSYRGKRFYVPTRQTSDENTNCTLKKWKKTSAQLSCVEVLHVNVGFFSAQLKCVANGTSVQNVNVLPNIYDHIFLISPCIYSVGNDRSPKASGNFGWRESYIYVKNFNTWQLCRRFFPFL
jgi:hypothetical protein